MIETVVNNKKEFLYNIKLSGEKSWKRRLTLAASIAGGLIVGGYLAYSKMQKTYKKPTPDQPSFASNFETSSPPGHLASLQMVLKLISDQRTWVSSLN